MTERLRVIGAKNSVISVISVGLYYTSSRKITKTTKDHENSRTGRKCLLLLRGAFLLFLLFLWGFIILKLIEFLSHGKNGKDGNLCSYYA